MMHLGTLQEYHKLCNKNKYTKGAPNANINVCAVISLKMLSISEIDDKCHQFLKYFMLK